MDIFQGNKELEDAALKGIEWGLYLRHDMESPIQSFMILHCGEKKRMRVIVDDENPMESAKKLLENEEEPFNYITIGAEVGLKGKDGSKLDAILVEAYDVSLEKGIGLYQGFRGKEEGEFEKIGFINFVNQPELGIPTRDKIEVIHPDPVLINEVEIKNEDGLTNHEAMISGDSAFQIGYETRKYLRAKLSDELAYEFSGKFDLVVSPDDNIHREFLNFMLKNVFKEVAKGEDGQHWEESTGRKLDVIIKYDEEIIAQNGEDEDGDALDNFLPKKPVESNDGKSGCMGVLALLSFTVFLVYFLI